ncbi:hypothetical protein T440DRAFT_22923 [Plenodomus tracheiphilus IPT5]|uniref:Uncharacterized protein n=1 Tax=Plenodomus tracheiphilus IPT5 TaxID=1408161 RepID=A0A6A7BBT7_9PLEO|nr:hypothetical protein T440DRAFT_22923 [Plenodomus tracheiphilus IPT5]
MEEPTPLHPAGTSDLHKPTCLLPSPPRHGVRQGPGLFVENNPAASIPQGVPLAHMCQVVYTMLSRIVIHGNGLLLLLGEIVFPRDGGGLNALWEREGCYVHTGAEWSYRLGEANGVWLVGRLVLVLWLVGMVRGLWRMG